MAANWTEKMIPQLQDFEDRTRDELMKEARRPVESLTPEHVDYLRAMMVIQNARTWGVNNFKTRWADDTDD